MAADLDQTCVNTIRFLSVDMVQKANSGHPGLPLGAAPMAYVLWTKFLKHHPKNPHWADRDRFVLSAGHGSALLYSLLYLTGYDLSLDDIKHFRQWGSKTPGHPERGHTAGVEVTTGPLGQGMANAVGMAMAEAQLAARYNRDGHKKVVDHHTYAIVSDGDLMEGVTSEAASLAGHLNLGKLICLYDDNYVTLAAGTDITFTENRAARFKAYGWHVQTIENGNDLEAIEKAIKRAKGKKDQPSMILVRTHIGFGSPLQDSYKAHGSPLGAENVIKTKQNLGWPEQPAFLVPDDALAHFREAQKKGKGAETGWKRRWNKYAKEFPDLAAQLQGSIDGKLPAGWDADVPVFPADAKGIATRVAGGKVLSAIAPKLPSISGGSADLDPSTHTAVKGLGVFSPGKEPDEQSADDEVWSYAGRNLHFGVREHAMGAIANGLAAHGGFIPYTATFMVFSDYMRPPMRLAAIMGLRVINVFTHDSIAVGEDGPTHEPVEQLAGLRSVPNLDVIRPGDANETAVAWKVAIESAKNPTALILSRQNVPTLDRTKFASAEGVRKGAYVLLDCEGEPELIVIGTGAETDLAAKAVEKLQAEGIKARAVSMPSWELFAAQDQSYRDSVLPPNVHARLAVEAGCREGWERWVGDQGSGVGVNRYGASAPGELVLEKYGFTVDNVIAKAKALLGKA